MGRQQREIIKRIRAYYLNEREFWKDVIFCQVRFLIYFIPAEIYYYDVYEYDIMLCKIYFAII